MAEDNDTMTALQSPCPVVVVVERVSVRFSGRKGRGKEEEEEEEKQLMDVSDIK